jgi:hypothetical protein
MVNVFMGMKTILAPRALSYGEMQPEPEQPEYDENGVDLTLIRWMMDMTPAERLAAVQSAANALLKARGERGEP